jgi:hypothetical protein
MSWVAVAVVGGAVIGGVATSQAGSKAASAQKHAADQANSTELAMYDQNREDQAPYRDIGYQALGELGRGMGFGGYTDGTASSSTTTTAPLSFDEWSKSNPIGIGDYRGQRGAIDRGKAQGAQQAQYDSYVKNFQPVTTQNAGTPGAPSTSTTPVGDLNRDFTLADFQKDPGYQFRMDEGRKGLEASAAARGGLLSGANLKAIDRYGQDYASGEYSNSYNRFNNDRTQRFNRLSAIAGTGQTATNILGAQGAQVANNVAQNQTAVGNANAARSINNGNAVTGTVNSLGNWYLQQQYLNKVPNGGGGYSTPPYAGGGANGGYGGYVNAGGITG